MQYPSISVVFVPHRLGCIYVSSVVPSFTQNMFLFLLHNYWVSVSHLNSPLMNIKQISLEVFPQKRVVYIDQCSVATHMLQVHTMGSPGFLFCMYEFCYLRCAEIQKN